MPRMMRGRPILGRNSFTDLDAEQFAVVGTVPSSCRSPGSIFATAGSVWWRHDPPLPELPAQPATPPSTPAGDAMIAIDLSGRTAIVTGASQGLGAAIAEMLHRAGAAVAITYWPDAQGANLANAERMVVRLGARAAAFPGDVRDSEAMATMVAAGAAKFGRVAILVNNAGIVRDRSFKKRAAGGKPAGYLYTL